MKKHILRIFIFLICLQSYCQSTPVTLLKYVVKNEIKGDSLINGISKLQLMNKMINEGNMPSDTLTVFYNKKGDYVSISKNKNINFINTFINKEKLIYQIKDDLNIVMAIDVTIDLEEKLGHKPSIKLLEKTEQIEAFKCSVIEVKWKSGVYRYYFSNEILAIDPQLFKDYNYDQWFNYLKISKALPLKIEKEINDFCKTTYTLETYDEKAEIDNSIFEIPKMKLNKELSKMYPNKKIFIVND
jgi:hypothetical protein